MRRKGLETAYQLAQATEERLSAATCHRLDAVDDAVQNFKADTLEALADFSDVEVADLFARSSASRKRA
jgi:Cro/C1-type HTH DNA-binding domain